MKNIIAILLISLVLAECSQTEPAPTVGKILGVQQTLSQDYVWQVGIMVHAEFVPYCTNNFELAGRAGTMIKEYVTIDAMQVEGSACPVLIDVTLYED
jgi:hypothetical protein